MNNKYEFTPFSHHYAPYYNDVQCSAPREWFTQYRGNIVRSVLDPRTGRIINSHTPLNQPKTFLCWINDYMKNDLN